MSGITGMGTTFNLPNYHGELFGLRRQTPPCCLWPAGSAAASRPRRLCSTGRPTTCVTPQVPPPSGRR
jgi:hypothetical protein